MQKLNREVQRKEQWLQEERMERQKLEVELGKEKDCNRVNIVKCTAIGRLYFSIHKHIDHIQLLVHENIHV